MSQVPIMFRSEPEGAVVLLNGEMLCPSTPCRKLVPSGDHDVLMTMERYESARQRFAAREGASVALTLQPKFGVISVTSEPAGVEISLNGKSLGTTPIARQELDPGAYEVAIAGKCWVTEGERFNLRGGEARELRFEPKKRIAGLSVVAEDVSGDVIDAEVFLDGERIGTAPGVFRVSVCSRRLVVKAAGAQAWERTLQFTDGEVLEMKAEFGTRIESKPAIAKRTEKPEEKRGGDGGKPPRFAVRAGLSGHAGFLGVSGEVRAGPVGFVLGTGAYALGGGLSFGSLKNAGGFYGDLHVLWLQAGLIGASTPGGIGLGASVGWDWRPVRWLSIKTGLGAGWNSARMREGGIPLTVDLAIGPVFDIPSASRLEVSP